MTDDRDVASILCALLRQISNSYRKTPAKDPGATSHQKLAPASSPDVATEATAVHSPLQEGAGFRHDHIEAPGGWMTDIQCTAQTLAHTRRCLVALPALPACSACQGSTGPRQRVALANHRLVFGFSQLSPLRRSLRDTCGWSTISTPSLFLTGRRGGRITTTSVHPLFTNDRPRPSLFENLSEPSFNDFSRPKPRMALQGPVRAVTSSLSPRSLANISGRISMYS
ncbi:hypothetical protein JMJ77_0009932 [Colletotrichum scovillei]|uniref:Uncharacterized protein n=1 Tax=Colletotrichum scovillei TaxID=1209932 RepID=A0A9P7U608_9PEZI|nr:hypothetical protein JMJ78_0001006 [Colletotrichum scovillei]KAG7040828.1 hypothetical protein JMJ77_0009932 [Colletotrichum scovillei]KAG7060871.1 hypothetical protein JMJ76_0009944 [Colletotrichum scovillei]